MASLKEARELWHKNMNQLVLLLSAISSTLDRGQYQAAQEQLDAAMLLTQRTTEAGRTLIEAGRKVQERIEELEADPIISAILSGTVPTLWIVSANCGDGPGSNMNAPG